MLVADAGKFGGLLAGIAFASFLSCFAAAYFAGFMTRSFALVAEQPGDVWVMDRTTASPDQFANLAASVRDRVRSVAGVAEVNILALGAADARMPDGRLQPFDVIGLDDATLAVAPMVGPTPGAPLLRTADAAIVDAGGSEGKLDTHDRAGNGPLRTLQPGDELRISDQRLLIMGMSQGLPRFPPRPLLYMSWSNAARVLPIERLRTSFVVVRAVPDSDLRALATVIERRTGFVAFTRDDFEAATVRWFLDTSEDVGDIATMLTIAVAIGFGFATAMLYVFTASISVSTPCSRPSERHPRGFAPCRWRRRVSPGCSGPELGSDFAPGAGSSRRRRSPLSDEVVGPPGLCPAQRARLHRCTAAALMSMRPVLRLDPARVFAS